MLTDSSGTACFMIADFEIKRICFWQPKKSHMVTKDVHLRFSSYC